MQNKNGQLWRWQMFLIVVQILKSSLRRIQRFMADFDLQ